jgi:carbonic anhydrase/acetyltransferase-like protein (isoleucine patch superfamily)
MSIILDVYRLARRIRDKVCSVLFASAFHRFGARTVICLPVRLRGERAIEFGEGVYLGAGCWVEVMEIAGPKILPVISIGDGTSVSGDCTITAVSRVHIGRGVLIARFVHISDHSHARDSTDKPIKDQGVTRVLAVIIRDGAWIGHGAVICPGVTIGRNAVVGANSVVRHDVPDHCVAAGIPARIIRSPKHANIE